MSAFYLSAAHKSSGKTTLSIGLSALFAEHYQVQTFKKGPDYIDPMWLSLASKNPCYNLDFWNMPNSAIIDLYSQNQRQINIIEGNKGLFDGLNPKGGDANADLAKLLDIPVVLVVDCVGITRGIAPLLQGYINFDTSVNIAGVILNKVGGSRHEAKLRQAVAEYTNLTVLGAVPKHPELIIDERHLGLTPANEDNIASQKVEIIKNIIKQSIDVKVQPWQNIIKSSNIDNNIRKNSEFSVKAEPWQVNHKLTIAIAKDKAFGFYYNDDLDRLKTLANVVFFDTFTTKKLPKCDGLFIGGGFPETNLQELSQNTPLLKDINNKIKNGLPTYAECGGMMYLTHAIDDYPMVGVIDAQTITTKKPVGRGYMQIQVLKHPWGVNGSFNTHEFHYSKLIGLKEQNFAFKVLRGYGITGEFDGIVKYNMLATYSHQRAVGANSWVDDFISFVSSKSSLPKA
jgi:cobyrinic acid a,c-diamide synthase